MEASDVKRLKELEDENRRLKHMYAELSLDPLVTKGHCRKKAVSTGIRREFVDYLQQQHDASRRRAYRVVGISDSVYRYQPDTKKG